MLRNYYSSSKRVFQWSQTATLGPVTKRFSSQKPQYKHKTQVYSGIQPTSIPHIGNYFGAIKQWVDMQNRQKAAADGNTNPMIVSIVDLHAITVPIEASLLNDYIYKSAAILIASGIDPNETILYQQSHVPCHGQLSWILGSLVVTMPQLAHLPQFKLKSDGVADVLIGLYTYPVLQCADILLYQSTHVPVGEDQVQHLELCRHVARRFNAIYATNFFAVPQTVEGDVRKLRSLRDPNKKMSKSDKDHRSRIELTDAPEAIRDKIKKAVTDCRSEITYEPKTRPGVSTLVDIDCAVTGLEPEEVVEQCALRALNTGQYKLEVAQRLIDYLAPMQSRYAELTRDRAYLSKVLADGARRANDIATANYEEIKKLIGF